MAITQAELVNIISNPKTPSEWVIALSTPGSLLAQALSAQQLQMAWHHFLDVEAFVHFLEIKQEEKIQAENRKTEALKAEQEETKLMPQSSTANEEALVKETDAMLQQFEQTCQRIVSDWLTVQQQYAEVFVAANQDNFVNTRLKPVVMTEGLKKKVTDAYRNDNLLHTIALVMKSHQQALQVNTAEILKPDYFAQINSVNKPIKVARAMLEEELQTEEVPAALILKWILANKHIDFARHQQAEANLIKPAMDKIAVAINQYRSPSPFSTRPRPYSI